MFYVLVEEKRFGIVAKAYVMDKLMKEGHLTGETAKPYRPG